MSFRSTTVHTSQWTDPTLEAGIETLVIAARAWLSEENQRLE